MGETRVPPEMLQGQYLPNESATHAYAGAGAVLNDHWDSMRDFGYISNRVYDALASGARLISDYFPELDREFGDVVSLYRSEGDFVEAAKAALEGSDHADNTSRALEVIDEHSFDTRAAQLLVEIRKFLGAADPSAENHHRDRFVSPRLPKARNLRIGVMPQYPDGVRWSSSAYIRLVLPLTSDLQGSLPDLSVLTPARVTRQVGSTTWIV